MANTEGPCEPWATEAAICGAPEDADPLLAARCLAMATKVLWGHSGRTIGICEVTVRPRAVAGCVLPRVALGESLLIGGVWIDFDPRTPELVTLDYPAAAITTVKVDGVALDPGVDFTLYNRRHLYRIGGRWPTENDLRLPDTEVGTWSITYDAGEAPDELAAGACGELAGEMMQACVGGPCKLPQRTQSITRQGLTVSMIDASELKGIGLRLCDLFLATVNPAGLAQPSGVYSIDVPAHARPA